MSGSVKHEQWGSKLGFILAAIGGAVGLGNIWRFPYITGENGGGIFVLIYILSVLFVAIPILIAELQLGKRGHKDIVSGTAKVGALIGRTRVGLFIGGICIAAAIGILISYGIAAWPVLSLLVIAALYFILTFFKPRAWQLIGWLGMLAAFFVLTYYAVIAGEVLDYMVQTATGAFTGASLEEARTQYDVLSASPLRIFLTHTAIMAITIFIVAKGVTGGIEKAAKFMMPLFFLMLLGLFFYSLAAGDFARGWDYMFDFTMAGVGPNTFLIAIGQAFFSIGISFGYMLAYGSYLSDDVSIPKTSVIISLADTGVAIMAGLVIFPLVFQYGLEPSEGADLIFRILPMVFSQMNLGAVVGTVFFLLLTFAALTSCIAILQPAVSYLEERWGFSVRGAALAAGAAAWLLGIFSVLSLSIWSDYYPLQVFETFARSTIRDIIDFITANDMMLVGGILIALFVGWSFKSEWLEDEFKGLNPVYYKVWLWVVRIISPAAVAIALYNQLTG